MINNDAKRRMSVRFRIAAREKRITVIIGFYQGCRALSSLENL